MPRRVPSGAPGRTLIEHDLADELRLIVFPAVVGAGKRLLGETASTKPFRLTGSPIGSSLAYLSCEIVRDAW